MSILKRCPNLACYNDDKKFEERIIEFEGQNINTYECPDCHIVLYSSEIADILNKVIEERDELCDRVEELEDELARIKFGMLNEEPNDKEMNDYIKGQTERQIDIELSR